MSLKKSHKSYPQIFKDEAVLILIEQNYKKWNLISLKTVYSVLGDIALSHHPSK